MQYLEEADIQKADVLWAIGQDLQVFLDNSPKGVIYLSFGSSVKTNALPSNKVRILLNVFHQLPFRVVMKWENDTLEGKPSNIYISKWLPQQDVLGHKNIKAFISQCGQQSVDETIHNEVPVLCMPFLGDQFMNVQLVAKFGIGAGYDFNQLEEMSLKEAIMDVAENKRYKKNSKMLSALLPDQKWTPLERAMWWTEYVLRHKGTAHMRTPLVPLYEYLMIDIAGLALVFLVIVRFILYVTVKFFKNNSKVLVDNA